MLLNDRTGQKRWPGELLESVDSGVDPPIVVVSGFVCLAVCQSAVLKLSVRSFAEDIIAAAADAGSVVIGNLSASDIARCSRDAFLSRTIPGLVFLSNYSIDICQRLFVQYRS